MSTRPAEAAGGPAIDLYDPATYVPGVPHEELARLRATSPVHWQDIPGQAGYWTILKHADVEHVSRDPALFSVARGGIVLDDVHGAAGAGRRRGARRRPPPGGRRGRPCRSARAGSRPRR